MLQLQPSFFKENEIFIQIICPQLCEVEKHKSAKESTTKFDVWNGLKDLSFIIPRNFSNLSQKSGGRSAGASATVNLGKRNDDDEAVEGGVKGDKKKDGQGFVGLKSPDHLKKVCNMFRNSEFKSNPSKYLQ
jgi:hypothetical protein